MAVDKTTADGPAALAEWVAAHHIKAQLWAIDSAESDIGLPPAIQLAALPDGLGGVKLSSLKPLLDEWRTHPSRRKGTACLTTLDSFIDHCNRFQTADTVLFADPGDFKKGNSPSLTSVLDYHQAVNPHTLPSDGADIVPHPRVAIAQFGHHRGVYKFPLSDEWLAWTKHNGQGMTQSDFAEFIEDRLNDVADPAEATRSSAALAALVVKLGSRLADPARLLELSRSLKVHVAHSYKGATNLASGETQFGWTEEHKDEAGAPLIVPNLFAIAIPVFQCGPCWPLPVRLRYRLNNGKVNWSYQLYQEEKVFQSAFTEACAAAHVNTRLPLLFGQPE